MPMARMTMKVTAGSRMRIASKVGVGYRNVGLLAQRPGGLVKSGGRFAERPNQLFLSCGRVTKGGHDLCCLRRDRASLLKRNLRRGYGLLEPEPRQRFEALVERLRAIAPRMFG